MIDVTPNQIETVTRILAGHVPECEVRAFGSRVTWTAKDYSDFDLVVVGERALDLDALPRLKEAFGESDLPFRVDVLDWHAIGPAFQKVIEKKYEVVQKSKKKSWGKAGEWIECTLADACSSIDYGLTASAADDEVGPRFLRITDIVSGHIDWKTVPHVHVDSETIAKYLLREDDIVLARTGASTGASAYVKNPPTAVFASYLVRLQAKPEFCSRFLAYYLRSNDFWTFIRGVLGDKSAQPNASASTMTKAPLRAPSAVDEQRAIAHILGTLDDKIELNRRMNETLEAMARALFKSWFVDFDPVLAKAEGRDPGLPKPLADLFPDSFEDSELGEIPKGWEVWSLADCSSLNPESWSKDTRPETIKYVDLANTKWGRIEARAVYPWKYAPSRAQRVLRSGDSIVGTVRPGNGSYAFVAEDGLTGSTGFAVLRPQTPEYREFVYLAATTSENIEALAHLADGGAYPAVRPEFVASTQAVHPPHSVVANFTKAASPLLAKMAQTEHQSRTLVDLRDTLLPKLISGELRVKDAERIVEIV